MTLKEKVRTYNTLTRRSAYNILKKAKEDCVIYNVKKENTNGILYKACIFGIKLQGNEKIEIYEEIVDFNISDDEAIDYFLRKATKELDNSHRMSYNE